MKLKALLALLLVTCMSLSSLAALSPTNVIPSTSSKVEYATDFNNFQLHFGSVVTVNNSVMPTLTNVETGEILTATGFFYWQMAHDYMNQEVVKVEFPTPGKNGQYKVTIPAGSISSSSGTNDLLEYTYELLDNSLVEVNYEPIEVLSSAPSQDAVVMDLGGDYTFSFNTTDNSAVNFLTWEFWDMTGGEDGGPVLLRQNNRNRWTLNGNQLASNTTDQWTENINFFVGGTEPLYEGKEYEMRVKFYGMGLTPADRNAGIRYQLPAPYEYEKSLVCEYTLRVKGGTKPYEFSDVTFTVSPNPDEWVIENVDQASFTFMFSAPVVVDTFIINTGNGSTTNGGTMESNDTGDVWILTLSPSQVSACLQENSSVAWSMGANDMDGRRIKGNDDISLGANSLTTYLTRCDMTTPHLTLVSPIENENGQVSELTRIVLSNEKGIEMRRGAAADHSYARLLSRQGAEIAVFNSFEINPDDNSQVIFTLNNPITTNGTYIFMVPEGLLLIMNGGEQGYATNLAFDHLFQVYGGNKVTRDFKPHTVVPAHQSTVASLKKVSVTFQGSVCLHPDIKKAQLYKGETLLEEKEIDLGSLDVIDWNTAHIEFSKEYTEAGNYEVVVPEQLFVDQAYEDSEGEEGSMNPELRYSYTVGTTSGIEDVAVEGAPANADVYGIDGSLIMRAASADDLKSLPAGIYIHGTQKVIVK